MAWLQRRPQVSDPTMFYSIGLNKTLLIVGLGNIGEQYDLTRHNVGFLCIDEFVKINSEMGNWTNKKSFKALESSGRLGEARVIAIKPTTFMNGSGEAIQLVAKFYNIPIENILVVHDELDVNFGSIKLKNGGSDAGHNGIKSISDIMSENYARIRIGIGHKIPSKIPSEKFVLSKFNKEELSQLNNLKKEVTAAISEFVFSSKIENETRNFLI